MSQPILNTEPSSPGTSVEVASEASLVGPHRYLAPPAHSNLLRIESSETHLSELMQGSASVNIDALTMLSLRPALDTANSNSTRALAIDKLTEADIKAHPHIVQAFKA